MKNRLVALTATAAMLAGGCGPAEHEFAPNRPALQAQFDTIRDNWIEQGVPLQVELRTLKGDMSVTCGSVEITADSHSPSWFYNSSLLGPNAKDMVIIADGTYNDTETKVQVDGITPEALGALIAGHEIGHSIIAKAGIKLSRLEIESTADCLAGAAIGATYPHLRAPAENLLRRLPGEVRVYGTPEQRVGAFANGFTNGMDGCHPDLRDRLIASPSPTPA